ncbi:MAG TPA: redoxin domain-containing protein [Ohtaekwangia sp.]|uniref:peroxiredoxin family protein n=1 Tax=Ohtaekwangia sp. TaxID=2066019 RepID=UPI002F9521AE
MKYIPVFIIAAIAILTVACQSQKKQEQPEAAYIPLMPAAMEQLPDMHLTLLDGKPIAFRSLSGKNILIMFQPDCDHCQREAKQFSEKIDAFNAYQIYFTSTAPAEELQKFSIEYKLNNQPNVHFGSTTANEIIENLGPIDAPSVYIYHDSKLIQKFNGETDIAVILKSI